jgi:hypothetical protein
MTSSAKTTRVRANTISPRRNASFPKILVLDSAIALNSLLSLVQQILHFLPRSPFPAMTALSAARNLNRYPAI